MLLTLALMHPAQPKWGDCYLAGLHTAQQWLMQLCPFGTRVFNFVVGSWPITTSSARFSCKLVGKEWPMAAVCAKNAQQHWGCVHPTGGLQGCSGGEEACSGNRQVWGLECSPELSLSSCKGLQCLAFSSWLKKLQDTIAHMWGFSLFQGPLTNQMFPRQFPYEIAQNFKSRGFVYFRKCSRRIWRCQGYIVVLSKQGVVDLVFRTLSVSAGGCSCPEQVSGMWYRHYWVSPVLL